MSEVTAKRVISFSPPDISELEIAEVTEGAFSALDGLPLARAPNAGVPFGGIC